jgi:hypothetical protein
MAMQRNKAEFFKTFRLILMKGSFLLYWAFSEANPERILVIASGRDALPSLRFFL